MFEPEEFHFEENKKKSETKAARNAGEKLAKKLYNEPPIDIFEIIKNNYGINIRELSFGESISAIVDLDINEITINNNKPQNHIRFTLAHELGHIVLNHKQRKWTDYSNNIGSSNPNQSIEEEANAFAAGLLMPGFLLKNYANKKTTPQNLALLFKVSQEAMWYSLDYYKLIKKFI